MALVGKALEIRDLALRAPRERTPPAQSTAPRTPTPANQNRDGEHLHFRPPLRAILSGIVGQAGWGPLQHLAASQGPRPGPSVASSCIQALLPWDPSAQENGSHFSLPSLTTWFTLEFAPSGDSLVLLLPPDS